MREGGGEAGRREGGRQRDREGGREAGRWTGQGRRGRGGEEEKRAVRQGGREEKGIINTFLFLQMLVCQHSSVAAAQLQLLLFFF